MSDYWDAVYRHGATSRSWFQQQPAPSLRMLDTAGVLPDDSVIDIGGGASPLVDALLARGHTDLAVLDISAQGLDVTRQRLGSDGARVRWQVCDLCTWEPTRTWKVWHDRAVLHFMNTAAQRREYLRVLDAATEPGSRAVLAVFAPDGPEQCSGLPVARYDAEQLAELLGDPWSLLANERELHTTPTGATQSFTWAAFARHRP